MINVAHGEERPAGKTRVSGGVRVIGLGHPCRSDDAAGLEVAARLREACPDCVSRLENAADPESLISEWTGHLEVIVVDAARSDAPPGTIHRFEAVQGPLPTGLFSCTSTHMLGLPQCIELARTLHRLPGHLWVYGIEGGDFEFGTRCSAPVKRAIEIVAAEIRGRWFTHDRDDHEASSPEAARHGSAESTNTRI